MGLRRYRLQQKIDEFVIHISLPTASISTCLNYSNYSQNCLISFCLYRIRFTKKISYQVVLCDITSSATEIFMS